MYPPPPPPPKATYYSQPYHHRSSSSSSCTRGTTIVMASILLFGHALAWLSVTYALFAVFGPYTVFAFNYQTAAVILTTVGIVGAARRSTGCLIAFIIHLVFALISCVAMFIYAILAVTVFAAENEERIEKLFRRMSYEWNSNWFVAAMIICMILLFFGFVYNAALLFFAISTRNEIVNELKDRQSVSSSRRPPTAPRQQYPLAAPLPTQEAPQSQQSSRPRAPKSPKSQTTYPKSPDTTPEVVSFARSSSGESP